MTDMTTLGEVLGPIVKRLIRPARRSERAQRAWTIASGEEVTAQTEVTGLKGGVLFVSTPNAPLRSELMFYRKAELLRRLREADPGLNVQDIRFRVDEGR